MAYEELIAAVVGFAPAIALLFLTLRPYTYPVVEKPYFDDRKLFGIFALGMGLGAVMIAVSRFFPLEYVFIAFLFEEVVKLVVLNLPRFQRRVDTAFYGVALGLGMGSTIALGSVTVALLGAGADAGSLLIVSLVSVQLSSLHGSTGGTIGIGVARGRPWPFFGQAVLIHLAYVLLLVPFYRIPFDQSQSLLGFASFGLATVAVASYYFYVHARLLPSFVSEALARAPKRAKKVKKVKG